MDKSYITQSRRRISNEVKNLSPDFVLRVKDLSVELDKEKIIENLNFEVKEREALVIMGPNGAGKTVLLRTLLGLLPFKGKIQWKEGLKINYVPTKLSLAKDVPLTVEEFFGLKDQDSATFPATSGRASLPQKEAIVKILEIVGIKASNILEKRVALLSSGQFQRLLIAWGLFDNPQVLLLDEPMAGIDVRGQKSIYSLLDKLRKERSLTILLVTHDLSIVYKLADRVICLNKKALCQGVPIEVLTPKRLTQLYGGEIKFYQHTHN